MKHLAGALLAVMLVMNAMTSTVNAAIVTFTGTWTNYTQFAGAADPLAILGRTFAIRADVDAVGNVTGGFIRITSGAGAQFNIAFTGPQGSSATSPFALNNIPTASGGLLSINYGVNVPDFSVAGLNTLNGVGGSATLAGNFGTGIGFYQAGITAVPEPGSAGLLLGLVASCVGLYRRKQLA